MSLAALTSDASSISADPSASQWLVLDNGGSQVLEADATLRFENVQEYRIADYQQEQGAFTSYNKVQVPFEVRLMLSVSGTRAVRTAFLTELDTLCASTDLFSIQTPVHTYASVNPQRYDWTMADGSSQLMKVTVYFLQIRVTAAAAFSNTAAPSGADPASGGTIQPQSPVPTPAPPATGVG